MEKGDISNQVVPRLCLVFEGLVGVVPIENKRAETVARKLKRWNKVVDLHVPSEPIFDRCWDLTIRHNFQLELVSWLPASVGEHLQEWLDRYNYPIGRVYCTSPDFLSRSIAHRPDLAAIYDPDPSHRFTYGSKGRIVESPGTTDMLGSF